MNSPGGHRQPDPRNGQQADPITGQPLYSGQQAPQPYGDHGAAWGPRDVPPGTPPPGSGRRNAAALVAVFVGLVVVLSAGGIGLHFWLTDPVEPRALPHPGATSRPATSPAASATERPSPTRSTEPSTVPDVEPMIAGWQPIADPRNSIAYDLPGGWKVEKPTVIVGFGNENGPRVGMHAVGTYQDEACPAVRGSYRGRAGIMGDPIADADPREVAELGARLWATAAAEVPKDDPSVPRPQATPVTVAGAQKAWQATVTITPPGGDCPAPEVKVTTVSFRPRADAGAVLFVMYTDQGVAAALPSDTANKIISTLRPLD